MNVLIWTFVLGLAVVASAEDETKTEVSVEKKDDVLQKSESHQYPLYNAGIYGHGYGDYGYMKKGYGGYGYGRYGDIGNYGDRGYGAYGGHAIGGYNDYDRYGGYGGAQKHYRDVDAYARNKGVGYERAYAYDKKAGFRDHAGDRAVFADHYGKHGRLGVHDSGVYGAHGFGRYAARDKFGAYGQGGYGHEDGGFGHYGNSHTAMYFKAPTYGYHY